MNLFDNESTILSFYRNGFKEEVTALFPFDGELPDLLKHITQDSHWEKWVNSSGKADPPPDFYCDEFMLMMEVMRVDDHAYINCKNRVTNPVNARESEMQKELQNSGILTLFPNVKKTICNPVTDLATKEDHNYSYYASNFVRIIEEHQKKIVKYKENHPNYKLIFFIMDESSAYMQAENPSDVSKTLFAGCSMQGRLHQYWEDETFIKAIVDSNADYFIWYTPWKHIELQDGSLLPLPKSCVFDIKKMSLQIQKYDADLMVSSEA